MIFESLILLKSFILLLTLNTLLGIRAGNVNASKGFAVMELQLPSSLVLKDLSNFLTFCCYPWKGLPLLAMVLVRVGLYLHWRRLPGRFLGLPLESSRGLGLQDHSPAVEHSQCQLLIKGFCANLLAPYLRLLHPTPLPLEYIHTQTNTCFPPTADSVLRIVFLPGTRRARARLQRCLQFGTVLQSWLTQQPGRSASQLLGRSLFFLWAAAG